MSCYHGAVRSQSCRARSRDRVVGPALACAALALFACDTRNRAPTSPDATHADARPADGTALCQGSYGALEDWGALADTELVEVSGIVTARRSPGVLWLHNDSGDSARLFAVASDGRALARLALPDVEAVDFEDVAAGPCPDGSGPCLFVADTGNNTLARSEVVVYATPEPLIEIGQAFAEMSAETVWRLPVRFPAEPVDIEAMVVDPEGRALYFFEKNNLDRARLFRVSGPFLDGQAATLEVIAELDAPGLNVDWGRAITGADMHASGTRVLVRVYTGVYEYRMAAGQGMADFAALERVLAVAGPLLEPQGEAVAYDAAGSGIVTVSEDPDGNPGQSLHHYSCR